MDQAYRDTAETNAAILTAMLEHQKLRYTVLQQSPEKTHIRVYFAGEDLPMTLHMILRADRQIVTVFSPMPFKMHAEKLPEAAMAVAAANHGLIDGSFDLNLQTGELWFRLTSCFHGTTLTEALFSYMMYVSAETVDRFNDRFEALNNGTMDLQGFLDADAEDARSS